MPPKLSAGSRIVYSVVPFLCQGCKRDKIDHYAKGMCYNCYVKARRGSKATSAPAPVEPVADESTN